MKKKSINARSSSYYTIVIFLIILFLILNNFFNTYLPVRRINMYTVHTFSLVRSHIVSRSHRVHINILLFHRFTFDLNNVS